MSGVISGQTAPGIGFTVNVTPIPTGGAVMLDFSTADGLSSLTGAVTIERATQGGTLVYTTVASGQAQDLYYWLDANDGSPAPLNSSLQYVYRITDATGHFVTDPVTPAGMINVIQPGETALLARLLSAAVQNVYLPVLITERPSVTTAMPLVGLPPLPMIVLNRELLQQTDVPIGQNVEVINPDGVSTTIRGMAKTMWRVSLLTRSPDARDFWSDAIVAIFMSICGSVAAPLGKNNSHNFQTAHYQVAKDGQIPGFYGADIMLDLEGSLNTTLLVNYGLIETISFATNVPPPIIPAVPLFQYNGQGLALSGIILINLPVTPNGLPIGALWSNAGFLCLVGVSSYAPVEIGSVAFGENGDEVIVGRGTVNYSVPVSWANLSTIGVPLNPAGLPMGALFLNSSNLCVVDQGTYQPPQNTATYTTVDATDVVVTGLPLAVTGLASGSLWNNGDFLCTA